MTALCFSIGRSVVLVALCTASPCWAGASEEVDTAKARRPNVLLIVADDMGYSDIGPFGGEIETPTLDGLSREGVRFTNFHVLPTCSPTRSVLLSGTDNHVAGLGTMDEFKPPEAEGNPGYAGHLNFQVAALPEVLEANGYRTYMVGKWHLGDDAKTIPHARGFDETFVLLQGGGSHWSDQKPISPTQGMTYSRNGEPVAELPEDFYSTREYTDRFIEWIERDRGDDKPFFAFLAYTAPHDPLHAPKDYIEKYKDTYTEGYDVLRAKRLARLKSLGIVHDDARTFPRLPTVKAWEDLSEQERAESARDMAVYAAMVDYLDGQVARVFEALRKTGEYDDTLIVFLSDNGANGQVSEQYPGQTKQFLDSFDNSLDNRGLPNSFIEMGPGWAQASMTPGRLFKAFPAEGGIRAPLIVKLPGKMSSAGEMNDGFLHVRDIMPTILDAVDVDPPTSEFEGRKVEALQGRSVLPVAQGKSKMPKESARVGYELFGQKAFIADGWKILWLAKPFGTGDWELFDLGKDPGEVNDLSETYPEKRAELIAMWEQYKTDNGVLDITVDLAGHAE